VIPEKDARKGWPGISSEQRSTQDAMLYVVNKRAMFLKDNETYKAANDAATLAL